MDVLEKVNLTILFDIYGELLTEKQRNIYEMYINNDVGLTEIGESLGISRQAAKDTITKVSQQLLAYETKLKLKKQFTDNNLLIDEILGLETFDGKEQEIRVTLDKLKKNL